MHKFISFLKDFKFPKKKEFLDIINSFSGKQFLIFATLVIIAFGSFLYILSKLNNKLMVEVPERGGKIIEGIIGTPTLVNPVLAFSEADRDLTSLVFSGLMRKNENGEFIPDLAESYPTISNDGKNYTFIINKNAKFHDGQNVTAKDVIFTISKIQDPLIKSPKKLDWSGITVTEKDEHTVVFTLKQPYISFMDNMTIGILPSHLWKNVNNNDFNLSTLNTRAVGSGPYKIVSVSKNGDNIPKRYDLKYFKDFTLGKPHIKKMIIIPYSNEAELVKALRDGSIDQAGSISPEKAEILRGDGFNINSTTLPRIFGIFLNENKNKIFADQLVVKSINQAINKQEIINQILFGYGEVINNPIPKSMINDNQNYEFKESDIEEINKSLDKNGWKLGEDNVRSKGGTQTVNQTKKVGKKTVTQKVKVNNGPITRLEFTLHTVDTKELKYAAQTIAEQLAKIGVKVEVKVYETGQLNQIIRDRNYESLLFGQVINHESNLYSFWHSSQKIDPGLNIAMYENKKVDSILDTAQKTLKAEERTELYKKLLEEFNKDIPAIFIYSPKFLYVSSKEARNIPLGEITTSQDRFNLVYKWYANVNKVWKIFSKE